MCVTPCGLALKALRHVGHLHSRRARRPTHEAESKGMAAAAKWGHERRRHGDPLMSFCVSAGLSEKHETLVIMAILGIEMRMRRSR